MVMVNIHMQMVLHMLVNGLKISNMEMVLNNGLMVQNMTDNIQEEKSMEEESLIGLMVPAIMETF